MQFFVIILALSLASLIFRPGAGATKPVQLQPVEADDGEHVKSAPRRNMQTASSVLKEILPNYDRHSRPYEGGPPTAIDVWLYIRRLSGISEVNMEFTIDCNIRSRWLDPRLAYDNDNMTIPFLHIDGELSKQIWMPDLFFGNEITSYLHSATVVNELMLLYPNGTIMRSSRYTITLACPMNLQYFPMDTQLCPIYVESFAYKTKEVVLSWSAKAVEITRKDSSLTSFHVQDFRVFAFNNDSDPYGRGTLYSCLMVGIRLKRSVMYYITQVYIPAALLVVISWFSLWMDQKFLAERVALGVTTVLTITTLLSSASAASPKISYVKAIDVFMGICFTFVFAALLESVVVAGLERRGRAGKNERQKVARNSEIILKVHIMDQSESKRGWLHNDSIELQLPLKDPNNLARAIDRKARVMFPLAYFGVNLVYWIFYLHSSRVNAPGWEVLDSRCLQSKSAP